VRTNEGGPENGAKTSAKGGKKDTGESRTKKKAYSREIKLFYKKLP